MVKLNNDWDALLAPEFEKDYYLRLREFLKNEYANGPVYPNMYHIFNALRLTSYADTRVVILGQDPYHGEGQAHGLCFSVLPGIQSPPSLHNIYKELKADLGCTPPSHGCLVEWATRGVLLLNTTLTVRAGQPASHKGKGWEIFTDAVISLLNRAEHPIVFILWGAHARSKKALITNPHHAIIESAHPSPLSASRGGFFGTRPFSRANEFLIANQREPIDWQISETIPDAVSKAGGITK